MHPLSYVPSQKIAAQVDSRTGALRSQKTNDYRMTLASQTPEPGCMANQYPANTSQFGMQV